MLGFVFAPSKRYIEPQQAAQIAGAVSGIAKVGVFVDEEAERVNQIAELCQLDFVQLHGREDRSYCSRMQRPVIKAFRISKECDDRQVNDYPVKIALLDSYLPGQNGGTGVAFDWQQAQKTCSLIKIPVLVAGGLTAANVAEAVAILKPAGVDVSGGVETEGVKDIRKITQFIQAARAAQRGC